MSIGKTNEYVELLYPSIIVEVDSEKVNLINGKLSLDFPRKKSIRTDKSDITTVNEIKKFVIDYGKQ